MEADTHTLASATTCIQPLCALEGGQSDLAHRKLDHQHKLRDHCCEHTGSLRALSPLSDDTLC